MAANGDDEMFAEPRRLDIHRVAVSVGGLQAGSVRSMHWVEVG